MYQNRFVFRQDLWVILKGRAFQQLFQFGKRFGGGFVRSRKGFPSVRSLDPLSVRTKMIHRLDIIIGWGNRLLRDTGGILRVGILRLLLAKRAGQPGGQWRPPGQNRGTGAAAEHQSERQPENRQPERSPEAAGSDGERREWVFSFSTGQYAGKNVCVPWSKSFQSVGR